MENYAIITDSACDLPEEYISEHNLDVVPLMCSLDGEIYGRDKQIEIREFYSRMRSGSMPTTMAINPEEAAVAMKKHLDKGEDVLYISFSSGLSASCQNAVMAANDLRNEYPSARIIVVDSLCASMGQGLLVHKALKLRQDGSTIEETAKWLEENKLHLCHQFTVDDLGHLQRGGRVSKATAVLGTLINVKPVLHVDDNGGLVSLKNVRGRKKSIQALVDNMAEVMPGYEDQNDDIFISHGDCIEDAQYMAGLIEERFGPKNFTYSYVGAVIGAHSGPGTLALFHMGSSR